MRWENKKLERKLIRGDMVPSAKVLTAEDNYHDGQFFLFMQNDDKKKKNVFTVTARTSLVIESVNRFETVLSYLTWLQMDLSYMRHGLEMELH